MDIEPFHIDLWLYRRKTGKLILSVRKPQGRTHIIKGWSSETKVPIEGGGDSYDDQKMYLNAKLFPEVTVKNSPHRIVMSLTSLESMEKFMTKITGSD